MGEKKGIHEEGLEENTRQDLLPDSATSICQCFICPRPASVKCPGCDLVACSLQHLALHRLTPPPPLVAILGIPPLSVHIVTIMKTTTTTYQRPAETCLPWSIDRLPIVGRVLLASRDIAPYELILKDSPLVIVPKKGTTPLAENEGKYCEIRDEDKEVCETLASKGLFSQKGRLSLLSPSGDLGIRLV